MFQKAVKSQSKLRLGLDGPAGSGKTFTALVAASAIANGGKVAVIDTERMSASLYADQFDFDVMCLDTFHPQKYIDGIHEAEKAGYAVIVIDSLSHAWEGEGGVLDLHDQAVKRQRTENSFTAWKDVTPIHRALVDAMLQSTCHIIATMRSKTEYIIESVESNGRTVQRPRKIGMAPIQRQGMEYEFTIVGDLDTDHTLSITKSRMSGVADAVVTKPDKAWFMQIVNLLNSGAKVSPPAPVSAPAETPAAAENLIMPLDQAENVTNKDGARYGDLDSETLSNMTIGIGKALNKPDQPQEKIDEYLFKRDAIRVILAHRATPGQG
jgi:hypothetical protein